jgi:hypothetical protein
MNAAAWLLLTATLEGVVPEPARPAFDWGQWGVGTRVTFRVVLETPQGEREGSYSQRLVRRDARGYTLSEGMALGGPEQVREVQWAVPDVVGEEALEAGPPECCLIWRATGRREHELVEMRAWVPRDGRLPARAVQLVGARQEASWTAVAFDEGVRVPAGEFRCWKAEGEIDTGQGVQPMTTWLHPDVPGGVVRSVLETGAGRLVFELEGFGTGGP